jgi:hypothetical protein
MNHNGVISLPLKTAFAAPAGTPVGIGTGGDAGLVVDGTVANSIGVLLHDVDASASELPAAVHLFNSGGIFNIICLGATAVGVGHNLGAKGLATPAGSAAALTKRFIPLEVGKAGGVIRAILISNS